MESIAGGVYGAIIVAVIIGILIAWYNNGIG